MTSPISRKLTALGLTAAIGVGAAAAPASSLAKAARDGRYTVSAATTYTFHNGPHRGIDGTLFKGQTVKVERLSPSGKWAYGMAYGHVNRHAWVKAADLKLKQ